MPLEPTSAAALKAYNASKHAIPILSKLWAWYKNNRIPKAKRNTLGIAIAVAAETEEQMPQITHDFINNLKAHAKRGALAKAISVVVVPPKPSKKAIGADNVEGRMKLLDKTECVLVISLFSRIRRKKGDETHVLDFNSLVKHEAITSNVRAVLAQEMTDLLAHRRHISKSNDLEEFEWSATSVHLAALYIVASAAILSEKPDYAITLLSELGAQLKEMKGPQPPEVRRTLQLLRAKLPINLAVAHFEVALGLHARWRKTRDVTLMDEVEQHLAVAGEMLPNLSDLWNSWALYHVVKNRDMRAARKELNKFKALRNKDPLWRLNLGFTYAYQGNMKEALKLYKAGCGLGPHMRTVLEVEEFLEWMLGEEPDKVQLHYVLGFVNEHGKGDAGIALHHYRSFLAQAGEEQFPEQREAARRFVEEHP